ncbi:MAG: hypothetical protein JWQ06_1388 [Mucilaginibacter sp.]|nr:hypothetical protein [Mucilaginibacter sp.]
MKFWLLLFLCILAIKGFSQEKSIAGIVFDKENQGRIAKINVVNLNSGQSVYNNLNGVFTIEAQPGDLLVFKRQEYISDTVKVQNTIPIAVYMKRSSIQLKEVTIVDTALTPEKKLAETKREYNKIYGSLAYHDFLSLPSSGGAGLSIDALYNAFSRSGRNARHLRNIIDRDYKQDVIDFRFNRSLVEKITGLKDKKLTDFMQKYRPGYFFVLNATDYEFIASIKTNYKRYLRNPKAYTLAPLMPSKE